MYKNGGEGTRKNQVQRLQSEIEQLDKVNERGKRKERKERSKEGSPLFLTLSRRTRSSPHPLNVFVIDVWVPELTLLTSCYCIAEPFLHAMIDRLRVCRNCLQTTCQVDPIVPTCWLQLVVR